MLAVLAAGTLAMVWPGGTVLDPHAVQRDTARVLSEHYGYPRATVHCPPSLPVDVHATHHCDLASSGGSTRKLPITITSDVGHYRVGRPQSADHSGG